MLRTAIMAAMLAITATGAAAESLTDLQKDEVRALIRDHLIENPEILAEAFEALQVRQQAAETESVKNALIEMGDAIRTADNDPVGGNPDGMITVVEFFDYNCPFCRRVKPEVAEFLKNDDRIRYVFKEFPILSASSAQASRAALAVWNLAPEKYWEVHQALMGHDGNLTEDQIRMAIEDAALDWDAIVARGQADDITEKIRQTLRIAERLNINGTPTFVIGTEIIPGFVEAEQLEAAVTRLDD
ncbi:hypothetical protein DLJ53_33100 [Acuticoccus sediminis]|uniref:Thioredoxin domain-containing protein n=1 Tax=Acuticoccus sediminis TaxID=2184697 RepID=A0A8B2NCP6_9HYPH|nr:DsbA family protein [Acuticoccus sediminis]RAH96219.1 hypothetical protein DLJ53_33100 [Acuticoccus sediminis]